MSSLGVREDAAEAEIREGLFRLAKEYHPDRHLQKEMSELKTNWSRSLAALQRHIIF